jgi:hypothetical protein
VNDLDRIQNALQNEELNHKVFERFAQDQLGDVYPGFTPIGGGTDWGRDGDIVANDGGVPTRVLITSSRTIEGVRSNMFRGIASMSAHDVAVDRIVLASAARLNLLAREKLVLAARKKGVRLDASDVFDQDYFASRLRRDGFWRKKLLGLPSQPISLSRVAPDIAESPWAHIPLVARREDLEAIQMAGDIIVAGPPGVGKSRLLGELPDVAFVDPALSSDQVASDLRWLAPSTVVVDDASLHLEVVRYLVALRRAEPELFVFKLALSTWPHDINVIFAELPNAATLELDLVERGPMDELLRSMGVSSELARAEIMSQAEGRPGWAVSLADLLLRSDNSDSLVNGRALLGQVRRYLQRGGGPLETMDLLAVMSAVGPVEATELAALAAEVDLGRAAAARIVDRWAKGGLVEVTDAHRWRDGTAVRHFEVRPPMLARVLVAERAFAADVPAIDFDGLADRWPDRRIELARAAIDATLLGAAAASSRAEQLATSAMTGEIGSVEQRIDLAIHYARLGPDEGRFVVGLARESFDQIVASGSIAPSALEPLIGLVTTVVRWYPDIDAAYELLFEACTNDDRPPHSNPGSAIRKIADLVQDFHPEIRRNAERRYLIASALETWVSRDSSRKASIKVAASVIGVLLDLKIEATHADPGNPMSIRFYRGIVPPAEMRRVHDEVLPRAEKFLGAGFRQVAFSLIDAGWDWMRVGGGFERSFGRQSSDEEKLTADELGRSLIARLAAREDLPLGALLKLRDLVVNFELPEIVEIPGDVEPLLRAVRFNSDDFRGEEVRLANDIRSKGAEWATANPVQIVERLIELRNEIEYANLSWPNRIWLACEGIAGATSDPVSWLDHALDSDLMPEAFPFAYEAQRRGKLDPRRLDLLLDDARTRPHAVSMLLSSDEVDAESLISELRPSDYDSLWSLCSRQEIDSELIRRLLADASPEVQAMVGVALFAGSRADGDWSPGGLEREWLSALSHLRPGRFGAARHYQLEVLLGYLARSYPDTLVEIVAASVREATDTEGGVYSALPHGAWDQLQRLPPASKSRLRTMFSGDKLASWMLNQHLVGTDIEWVEQAIDAGEMTADEALGYCTGLSDRPPVEALAKALVPRGAAPERVAGILYSGSWTGEQSERYHSFVEMFEQWLADDDVDPSMKAVAEAGVAMFEAARKAAAKEEHEARVRGER